MKNKLILLLVAFTLLACDKNSGIEVDTHPSITKFTYELFYKDVAPIEGSNLKGLIWESDYNFVATEQNGCITARHVGEAIFTNNKTGLKIKAIVKPKYQYIFDSKYMNHYAEVPWGVSLEELDKKYHLQQYAEQIYGIYIGDSDPVIYLVLYHFDNSNKLDSFALGIELKHADKLVGYLAERYEPLGQVGTYKFTFAHKDKQGKEDLFIYVVIDDVGITATFIPLNTKSEPQLSIIKEFNSIINSRK